MAERPLRHRQVNGKVRRTDGEILCSTTTVFTDKEWHGPGNVRPPIPGQPKQTVQNPLTAESRCAEFCIASDTSEKFSHYSGIFSPALRQETQQLAPVYHEPRIPIHIPKTP